MCRERKQHAVSSAPKAFLFFSYGRHIGLAACSIAAGTLLCFFVWDLNIPTHILGQFNARWVSSLEVIPLLAGIASVSLVAPSVPKTDLFAAKTPRLLSTMTACSVTLLSSLIAPFVVWILGSIPRSMVPRIDSYVLDDQRFYDIVPIFGRGATSVTVAFILGFSLMTVAVFGRVLGTMLALLGYLTVIVIQSHDSGSIVPLPGAIGVTATISAFGVGLALASIALGSLVWFHCRASAPLSCARNT